jgi:hypothetical protein
MLFALDVGASPDRIWLQNPANAGTLVNPVSLDLDLGVDAGFDIAGADNVGLVAGTPQGRTGARLYQVDVISGETRRIWSRIGRRPLVAGGNSNGDIQMLRYAGGKARPALRLLVLHDDAEREFDYTAGAEKALEAARAEGWTVVSVRDDWSTVFTD